MTHQSLEIEYSHSYVTDFSELCAQMPVKHEKRETINTLYTYTLHYSQWPAGEGRWWATIASGFPARTAWSLSCVARHGHTRKTLWSVTYHTLSYAWNVMDPIWKSLNLAPGLGRSENDLGTDGTWFVVGLGSSHACDAIVTLAMQYIQHVLHL